MIDQRNEMVTREEFVAAIRWAVLMTARAEEMTGQLILAMQRRGLFTDEMREEIKQGLQESSRTASLKHASDRLAAIKSLRDLLSPDPSEDPLSTDD